MKFETSSHVTFTPRQLTLIKELFKNAKYRMLRELFPVNLVIRETNDGRKTISSITTNSVIEIDKGK